MKSIIKPTNSTKINNNLFSKIFLSFSFILVLLIIVISQTFIYILDKSKIDEQFNISNKIVDEILEVFVSNNDYTYNFIQQLYNNDVKLQQFEHLLKHDVESYIEYALYFYLKNDINLTRLNELMRPTFDQFDSLSKITFYSKELATFFEFNSNEVFKTYKATDSEDSRFGDLFEHFNSNNYSYYMDSSYFQDSEVFDNNALYRSATLIRNPTTYQKLALMILGFDDGFIQNTLKNYKQNYKGYILILDNKQNVILDTSSKYSNKIYPYTHLLKTSVSPIMLDEKCYVNTEKIFSSNITIASVVPVKGIKSVNSSIRNTIRAVTLILIFLSILMPLLQLRVINNRLSVILKGISKLKKGDFTTQIPLQNKKSDDELNHIARNFNHMTTELNDFIKKVYVLESQQKEAELLALQSQINPHFLYNTLEAIRMNAVNSGSNEVADMIYSLGNLFRISLQKQMVVSIDDEVMHCKLYLELLRIRYRDRLNYEINTDSKALKYSIIKFALQPLIENCIIHGIDKHRKDNIILLDASLENDYVIVKISDNGKGIDDDKLKEINSSLEDTDDSYPATHIGLHNVNKRLKNYYGDSYSFDIESKPNKGTLVTLTIPPEPLKAQEV